MDRYSQNTTTPNVRSVQDYYPFGMHMPGRSFVSGDGHRYGYQGSESEKGAIGFDSYSTHFRFLDVRTARWFSCDPIVHPYQTAYSSMDNNPIIYNDMLGDKVRNLRTHFILKKYEIDLRRQQVSADNDLNSALSSDIGNHILDLRAMRSSEVVYKIGKKVIPQSDKPNGSGFEIAVNQKKSDNRLRKTHFVDVFINEEAYEMGLAGAVAVSGLYESEDWSFTERPGEKHSHSTGKLTDQGDMRQIFTAQSIWRDNANEIDRQNSIDAEMNSPGINNLPSEARTLNSTTRSHSAANMQNRTFRSNFIEHTGPAQYVNDNGKGEKLGKSKRD